MLPYLPKKLIWVFSKRYIAGETVNDAIRVARDLNHKGVKVTLDILGEFIKTLEEAEKNKQEYLSLIDIIQKEKIDGNYSVKPTMFGLLIDKEVCYQHLGRNCCEGCFLQQFHQNRYGGLIMYRPGNRAIPEAQVRISQKCWFGGTSLPKENPG